jgi:hypothetical protein
MQKENSWPTFEGRDPTMLFREFAVAYDPKRT